MSKKNELKSIIERLHRGEKIDDVKDAFKKSFEGVPAKEIAEAEKELIMSGVPLEEVQRLCDVHATLFEGAVDAVELPFATGHPIHIFREENEGILNFIETEFQPALQEYLNDSETHKSKMERLLHQLQKIDLHYKRKEILFFPYLEKKGITAPPKVMWGVDDEIRELLRQSETALAENNAPSFHESIRRGLDRIFSMVTKEQEILTPLLLEHLEENDWKTVAKESLQIGYVFTGDREGASPSDAQAWLKEEAENIVHRTDAPIQLPSGHFTEEELTHILNVLPGDITFVGNDDTVHFFSEQKKRVFPRTRTIIGRKVEDCHPPKSLAMVEELIRSFKDGTKDQESFWIQQNDLFILIRYYAVRNDANEYLGVVEVTEEISNLRKLEGSKTLLG